MGKKRRSKEDFDAFEENDDSDDDDDADEDEDSDGDDDFDGSCGFNDDFYDVGNGVRRCRVCGKTAAIHSSPGRVKGGCPNPVYKPCGNGYYRCAKCGIRSDHHE